MTGERLGVNGTGLLYGDPGGPLVGTAGCEVCEGRRQNVAGRRGVCVCVYVCRVERLPSSLRDWAPQTRGARACNSSKHRNFRTLGNATRDLHDEARAMTPTKAGVKRYFAAAHFCRRGRRSNLYSQ